ncbi:MAG: glycosyltransferase family 2 protein [Bacteroidales bacterium]|jgi:glycosyltransferase involved in cell wall biosynthesis|nr:glycosyltransferase family 2 protein [Bacteroidales bacterium]
MIRFSVVIPLYNKANFVKKTVESILAQTCKEFEIVIVNDGSTDNSLAVVSEINDPRIRIFTKPNGGVSDARNYGIEKAQYGYIAFLDADDLWLPDYLETQKGMIEQYPQAGVYATGYTIIYRAGDNCDRVNVNLPKGTVLLIDDYCKALIKNEITHPWTGTICVKRELFNCVDGFMKGVKRGEDVDMWLRLSLISPVVWKNETKAIYNLVTENNATFHYDSYKNEFPYWKWYKYDSSIYLKMYTNRTIKRLLTHLKFRDKISVLSKVNWYYVWLHALYHLGYTKDLSPERPERA